MRALCQANQRTDFDVRALRHGKEHLQIAAEEDEGDQRRDEEQKFHFSCIAQLLFTFKKTDGD